ATATMIASYFASSASSERHVTPYSCNTSSVSAHGSYISTLTPYSFNSRYTSTTLVLRTSGQFSLNVTPKINALEPLIERSFPIINFTTLDAMNSATESFTRRPDKITLG